jgi:hypothetical protein
MMAQNGNGTHSDILSLLSAERRAEIIAEALTGAIQSLLTDSADKSLGKLVDELQAHPNWEDLKALPAALVLGAAPKVEHAPQAAASDTKPAVEKSSKRGPKSNGAKAPASPTKKSATSAEGAILDAIKSNQDLRGVDIVKLTGLPQKIVTSTLAKLREDERIKGRGHGRGMTYTLTE